jgi:hypothetical protein
MVTKLSAVEQWKARSAREVELPSGTKVTIRLTTIRDEILAGSFSTPVLALARKMEAGTLNAEEDLTDDTLREFSEFIHTMVARAVVAVDGEPIELAAEDIAGLPGDDVDEIWAYVQRQKRLPKDPQGKA